MPFDSIEYLAARWTELAERAACARAANRPASEIAQIDDMLTAVRVLLERRATDTFH